MRFSLSTFLLFFLTSTPFPFVQPLLAAERANGYIVGFSDWRVKATLTHGQEYLDSALKPILRSGRRVGLSTGSVGRYKRNVIRALVKGDQSYIDFIGAKVIRNDRAFNDAHVAYALKEGLIRYIEPNSIIQLQRLPNDSGYGGLWGMNNTKGGFLSVANVDINAPEAWDTFTGSKDVVVAVLDTGIDPTVADLKDNMWVNRGEVAANGVDDDGNGYVDDVYGCNFVSFKPEGGRSCGVRPHSTHSHGTHCAGTIGAKGNNGTGVVGVNWDVSLMSLAFLADDGSGELADVLEGMQYAVMMKRKFRQGQGGANIRVINASFGHNDGFDQSEYDGIKALKEQDILFVAAAGNGGQDSIGDDNDKAPTFPAAYDLDNIIAVGAVGQSGALAYFSNYGVKTVDIAAPGVGIKSTVFGNKVESSSGTSMAAPHVAGVAGLLLGYKPRLNYWVAREILLASSKDAASVPALNALSGLMANPGMVDAAAALQLSNLDLSRPRIIKDPLAQTVSQGRDVSFVTRAFSTGDAIRYQWRRNGTAISGGSSSLLKLTKVRPEQAGTYDCVVTVGGQTVTSRGAQLTVTQAIAGDVNSDGKIDFADVMIVFTDLGKKGTGLRSDVNGDGVVDLNDADIVIKGIGLFKKSQSGSQSIGAPAAKKGNGRGKGKNRRPKNGKRH